MSILCSPYATPSAMTAGRKHGSRSPPKSSANSCYDARSGPRLAGSRGWACCCSGCFACVLLSPKQWHPLLLSSRKRPCLAPRVLLLLIPGNGRLLVVPSCLQKIDAYPERLGCKSFFCMGEV